MIYIDKAVTANGAPAAHHKVVKAELAPDGTAINIQGMSWATIDQRLDGQPPLSRWGDRIELADLAGNAAGLLAALGDRLVSVGPLAGGTIIQPEVRTLEEAKVTQWAEIKRMRGQVEYGGFVWDGSTFDSDETSRSRIQGAVQLAVIAMAAEQPYSIDWTLADDSVRMLSGEDMVAIGLALGSHVAAAFDTARDLRDLIDAATTVEEVQAVVWPTQ